MPAAAERRSHLSAAASVISSRDGESQVHVAISPPDTVDTARRPCAIVCVVDVSGSMQLEASVKTEQGLEAEQTGLSRLDLVKHALKTISKTLNDTDELAIVSFSKTATTVLPLMPMTDGGRSTAASAIEALHPQDATNLWSGMAAGYGVLEAAGDRRENMNQVMLLLTDGQPNECEHPEGELGALRAHFAANEVHRNVVTSTFGFGYDLDSKLLHDIAILCGGTYAFIPDASFVGTAFVNAVANCLTLFAPECRVELRPADDVKITKILGSYSVDRKNDGKVVLSLGPLLLGQNRSFVIQTAGKDTAAASPVLKATVFPGSTAGEGISVSVALPAEVTASTKAEIDRLRLLLCASIDADVANEARPHGTCPEVLKSISEFKESSLYDDPAVQAMFSDLTGQVTEAFQKEYFTTWGQHYLRSLGRSHALQQCTNFKDPGLQYYGGALCREIRDLADEVFCELPPPQPAVDPELQKLLAQFGGGAPAREAPPIDMRRVFHNRSNPCFHPEGRVSLASGKTVQVDAVKAGDILAGGDQVVCVVRTRCEGSTAELCELGDGLKLTPWHPVRLEGQWRFPATLALPQTRPCTAVYSFVLDRPGATLIINDIECIALAHGVMDDPVARHPFWGTNAVKRCLKGFPGWKMGYIDLEPGCTIRHPVTGLVIGLRNIAPIYATLPSLRSCRIEEKHRPDFHVSTAAKQLL